MTRTAWVSIVSVALGAACSSDPELIAADAGSRSADAAVVAADAAADARPDAAPPTPDARVVVVGDHSVSLARGATGFALGGDSIYIRRSFDFEEPDKAGIYRCPISGCIGTPPSLIPITQPHLQQGSDVAVVGDKLVWVDEGDLFQANLDGSRVELRYDGCADCQLYDLTRAGETAYVSSTSYDGYHTASAQVVASRGPADFATVPGTNRNFLGTGGDPGIYGVAFAIGGGDIAFCQEAWQEAVASPIMAGKLAGGDPNPIGAAAHIPVPEGFMTVAGNWVFWTARDSRDLSSLYGCPLAGCGGAPKVVLESGRGPIATDGRRIYVQFFNRKELALAFAAIDLDGIARGELTPTIFGDDDRWFREATVWQMQVANGRLYAIGMPNQLAGNDSYEARSLSLPL